MIHFDDIQDNEIRLINHKVPNNRKIIKQWWFWSIIAVCLVAICLTIYQINNNSQHDPIQQHESTPALPNIVNDKSSCVIICDTSINDVPLRIYTPQNAEPELCLGCIDTTDYDIIMAFQAADIRADNRQIVGDFVEKGTIISNGKSKKAFCAIINGQTYIDNNEESHLFNEAIEKQGYFFRQYGLVINGELQDNKPKGKSIRHALCEKDGIIMVVSSCSRESFHDFAQALADLDIQQAIYLTGGTSYGFCRTEDHTFTSWGEETDNKYSESLNFILWKAIK